MAARDRAPRWSECARAADSGSLRNPWVSWGGEHRSTRIRAIRTRGAQTRGPREIEDFVGWETRGPREIEDFGGWEMARAQAGRIRGPREACFVGWIGVRDPATPLHRPPLRIRLAQALAGSARDRLQAADHLSVGHPRRSDHAQHSPDTARRSIRGQHKRA